MKLAAILVAYFVNTANSDRNELKKKEKKGENWGQAVKRYETSPWKKCNYRRDVWIENPTETQPVQGHFQSSLFKLHRIKKDDATQKMEKYQDGLDKNSFWICNRATCAKFCHKSYLMVPKNGDDMVHCVKKQYDTIIPGDIPVFAAGWNKQRFSACRKCKDLRNHPFTDPNVEVSCPRGKDFVKRQTCYISCANGGTVSIESKMGKIEVEPSEEGATLELYCGYEGTEQSSTGGDKVLWQLPWKKHGNGMDQWKNNLVTYNQIKHVTCQ
jgi:hypothetical protein